MITSLAFGSCCKLTLVRKRFSHEYRMKFYITRCENADFHTRSVRKTAFYTWGDENIISLFLSFSNTERREVVFRTQWFIGQYCSEREGRRYRCRCTSVPLSLYERTFVAILHFHLMMACYDCIPQTPGKSRRFLPFPNNHRCQSKVLFTFSSHTEYVKRKSIVIA